MRWIEGNRVTASDQWETVSLGIEGGRIASLRTYRDGDSQLPVISPGFIDIHVHGAGGADTMDATADAFDRITQTHAKFGTTSLLLTSVTESPARIDAVLTAARAYMNEAHQGARVLGIHLEGPFIHPDKAGAQNPHHILEPDPKLAAAWFSSGIIKMMTLAPEQPGAHEVARLAQAQGIVAAAGHTTVTAPDMQVAVDQGFSHVTHLCNAMRPLLHREPGPIGRVVVDDRLTADLICDGIHVDSEMVTTLLRAVGEERLMLITDAIRAASEPAGVYDLGGLTVTVKDGACRLADGTLAGSLLTMSEAVRGVMRLASVPLFTALKLASYNPARRLGLMHKGRIEVGYDADLVCLDRALVPLWTMVNGEMVYEREGVRDAHSRV